MGEQAVTELLGRFGGEEARVCKGKMVDLGMQRHADCRVGMAKARYRYPARPVEIAFAIRIYELAAIAEDRPGGLWRMERPKRWFGMASSWGAINRFRATRSGRAFAVR